MNLEDISNIYQEELKNFFRNEKVIELIYKKQFGTDAYDENKADYINRFNNIMANTVFMPFIRLKDLDNMLIHLRISHNDDYMKKNFREEINLSKKLHAEERSIIQRYSSFMLDDLKELFPKLTKDQCSKILKGCSNKSFDENAQFIEDELFRDKKPFFTKLKKNKVEKLIERYKKLTSEKILMETSTFYKHCSDIPNGKYSTDILEVLSNDFGEEKNQQKIGRNTDRNMRYIFLPVLTYNSKMEYLKAALHEVMHISKEQLSKNHYKSGLLVRKLAKNPNVSEPQINYNIFIDLFKNFIWNKKVATKNDLESNLPKYNTYDASHSIEEVIHHSQTCEVLSEISENGLIDSFHLPYIDRLNPNFLVKYELFDPAAKKFISKFKEDIQKINNNKLSLREFKQKIGITNFDLFAHASNLCTSSSKSTYNSIGSDIVDKMVITSNRRAKLIEGIHKLKSIGATDLLDVAKRLAPKFPDKPTDVINSPTR